MADILTLSDYKLAKGIQVGTHDSQYESLIPMVNQMVEGYCMREFGEGTYEETKEGIIDNAGRYFFTVKNKPLNSINSISLKFIGVPTPVAITVADVDILSKQGYAYYYADFLATGVVIRPEYRDNFLYTINYEGGEKVPENVKLAAIMMVSDTFEYLKRTSSPGVLNSDSDDTGELKSVKIGDYQETYATSDTLYAKLHSSNDQGVVLTPTVRSLLAPYKRLGQNYV